MDRMPIRTIKVLHILREEYALFHTGLPRDPRLPLRYENWEADIRRIHEAHRAAGSSTVMALVRWDEFCDYARKLGVKPSYAILSAYAVKKGETGGKETRPANLRVLASSDDILLWPD